MVAIPDSRTDPVLLNGIEITVPNNNTSTNNNVADNTRRVRDQAFAIPHITISTSDDNYTLKFEIDRINDKKLNTDNINAEPVVMKKIAGKKYYKLKSNSHRSFNVQRA